MIPPHVVDSTAEGPASGIMMLSFNTTEYHGNPFLYLKFPVILFGLLNVALIQRLGAWRRLRSGQAPATRSAKIGWVIAPTAEAWLAK